VGGGKLLVVEFGKTVKMILYQAIQRRSFDVARTINARSRRAHA
jgi:hypothetical protein